MPVPFGRLKELGAVVERLDQVQTRNLSSAGEPNQRSTA
jgi:hypothetical protein